MLAERAGISVNHVTAVETGARFPSSDYLEGLASALDTTPALLLMDQNEAELFEDFKKNRVVSERVADQLIAEVRRQIEGGSRS